MIKKLSFYKKAVICLFILNSFNNKAQEMITVHANYEQDTSIKFMQGFLHGGAYFLDSGLVAKLRPSFWRIGAYWLAGSNYSHVKKFNPKITINLNDIYMIIQGIPTQTLSKPWTNGWKSWDSVVAVTVNSSVIDGAPVDYWDVWGEPDAFWTGTVPQFIEMYRRTDSIIGSIIPSAKITGPEFGFPFCDFSVTPILGFLDSLHSKGAMVNGVSWHELCNNPENVPNHVQQLRDSLAVRPWCGNLTIHIPEYASPQNSIVPGWNLGWLYYLEKSKLNWVSHACWNESNGVISWSNCEFGLNGLFMKDNITPQPNYWVHRAYSELNSTRLVVNISHVKTIALASKNNSNQEMKIIVGRYDNPILGTHNAPANVKVKIKNYPYCSSCTKSLVIQHIPSNNVPYSVPLRAPITTYTGNVNFNADSTDISINGFIDGDVYVIYINPSETSLLVSIDEESQNEILPFKISPNPVSENLSVILPENQKLYFQILNNLCRVVKEVELTQSSIINLSNLASGLYFIKVKDSIFPMQKFIKQ